MFDEVLKRELPRKGMAYHTVSFSASENDAQTQAAFSHKWTACDDMEQLDEKLFNFQRNWFLSLYGFENEQALSAFLADKKVILDAGCGMGYKAAWFAELAPHAQVIGMDYSESIYGAAQRYQSCENLDFVRGDIADTNIMDKAVDFVCCDQVIMHTENPEATFAELSRITSDAGEFACYVYRKKALPRELLDDYFRVHCKALGTNELMELSKQLTQLGQTLTELDITINIPDMPALGIKGGEQDLQRFIYWNFIKCFWNPEFGEAMSTMTNFDWYSPSNAKRFSKDEFKKIINDSAMNIVFFHEEEACYSGRFAR